MYIKKNTNKAIDAFCKPKYVESQIPVGLTITTAPHSRFAGYCLRLDSGIYQRYAGMYL